MSEATPAAGLPPAPQAAAPPQPELIGGKWKDDNEAQKGMRELFKHRNIPIPDNSPVYGEGGPFANRDAALIFYKGLAGKDPSQVKYVDAGLDDVFKAVGVDPAAFAKKIAETNDIDDDHVKAFGKVEIRQDDGTVLRFNKDLLRDIFVGRAEAAKIKSEYAQRKQAELVKASHEIAGGTEEHYKNVMAWANTNLDANTLASYKQMLANPDTTLDAVRLIKGRFDDKHGNTQRQPVVGGAPISVGSEPKTLPELKELTQRAMAGDITAQRTLKTHKAAIERRFA